MILRALLLINAVASAAAGIVLFVHPDAIAGVVGIHLPASAGFVYYLLAAAELGFSALCWQARGLRDPQSLRAVSIAMIVFHAASGLGGLLAYGQGIDAAVLWNVLVRVLMVVLFLIFGVLKNR